jgi:hypothetical protein
VLSGILKGIFEALAADLRMLGLLDVREAFIDGSFAPAKKGDPKSGRRSTVKEPRLWAVADSHGLPVGLSIESASPHEV